MGGSHLQGEWLCVTSSVNMREASGELGLLSIIEKETGQRTGKKKDKFKPQHLCIHLCLQPRGPLEQNEGALPDPISCFCSALHTVLSFSH
jgi:hypothetical protein